MIIRQTLDYNIVKHGTYQKQHELYTSSVFC
nr:MAG TPA: hypothetical protein [Caudoviricetes sp.]